MENDPFVLFMSYLKLDNYSGSSITTLKVGVTGATRRAHHTLLYLRARNYQSVSTVGVTLVTRYSTLYGTFL
jgi:hypothetical protein